MDKITYKPVHKRYLSLSISPRSRSYYGTVESLSKNCKNFQDNSLQKEVLRKELNSKLNINLQEKHKNVKEKVNYFKSIADKAAFLDSQLLLVKEEMIRLKKESQQMEKSATKIQKVTRGYLIRKKYEDEITEIINKKTINCLGNLRRQNDYMIFGVGLMPDIAAKRIQKLCKIYIFRKKIFRLQNVYEILYEAKVIHAYKTLVPVMQRFHAKVCVMLARQESNKQKRLKEIREKIAIFKIRRFYKKKKLNFRLLRLKVKKWRRQVRLRPMRKKAVMEIFKKVALDAKGELENKAISQENQLTIPQPETIEKSPTPESVDNEDALSAVDSQAEPDEEAIARQKLLKELEELRKAKLKISGITYNCKKLQESRLLPYLIKREANSQQESPTNLFISLPIPDKKVPKLPERSITTKNARKINPFEEPNYMRQTMCFSRRRWDAELIFENEEDEEKSSKTIDMKSIEKISKPTTAFLQKISTPRKWSPENQKIWRPNTQYEPEYIGGIDNPHFMPKLKTFSKISTATHSPSLRTHSNLTEVHTESLTSNNSPENKKFSPFSLTFQGALPELSSFITQYSPSKYRV
ncbi:unnamed protein product [Blepharisma stoltei]|uniref:Uncharacterized protein n=1 Tax=Blepharisma stoltei TaxID=1481888 RepID=A0AAU9JUJ7_9CILI|nr:unnamed protein product [Blepharisma stoltei]